MIKITGTIKKVFPTEVKSNGFHKRIFWLDDDTEKYPNVFQFELWKDDVIMIDSYEVGDVVTCFIDLKGRYWNKEVNGKIEQEGVMNSLKCWNIEKNGKPFKKMG